MKNAFFALMLICLIFTAFKCDDDASLVIDEDKKELAALKKTIQDLVDTSVCDEDTSCQFMAFGSKPCGGPWNYLFYSTSIDVEELTRLVEVYNQKEAAFNTAHNIISDCSVVMPPSRVICENNTCIPVY